MAFNYIRCVTLVIIALLYVKQSYSDNRIENDVKIQNDVFKDSDARKTRDVNNIKAEDSRYKRSAENSGENESVETDDSFEDPDVKNAQTNSDDVVSIGYDHYKIATGDTAKFTCNAKNYDKNELLWLDPSGSDIDSLNNTRFSDVDGVLTIRDVTLNDTGDYTCATSDGMHNATVELITYVMPDYFLEGMIILCVNAGLIVLFCICCIVTTIKNRSELKKYKAYKKATLKQELYAKENKKQPKNEVV